jgi:hypothetical protein
MVAPVNRCQSPISTAKANPVRYISSADPTQAAQPPHDRVNSPSAEICSMTASSRSRRALAASPVS